MSRGDPGAACGAPPPPPFRYKHAGDLATIGKRRAVIDFGWIQLRGAHRVVALGLRPHLLSDRRAQPAERRAQLAVDLRARPAQRAADHLVGRRGGGNRALPAWGEGRVGLPSPLIPSLSRDGRGAGVRGPAFNRKATEFDLNSHQNGIEVIANLGIGEAKHANALAFENFRAPKFRAVKTRAAQVRPEDFFSARHPLSQRASELATLRQHGVWSPHPCPSPDGRGV